MIGRCRFVALLSALLLAACGPTPEEAAMTAYTESREAIEAGDWSFQMDLAYPIFDVQQFMQEGQKPVARKILEGHAGAPTQIVYTRNWRFLITISYTDYSLRVWDIQA